MRDVSVSTTGTRTVVSAGVGTRLFVWGLFPVLGAGAGVILSLAPGWAARLPDWVHALPMVPGAEQIALLAGLQGAVLTSILAVVGLAAGLLLALTAHGEMVAVEVSPGGAVLASSERREEYAREDIGAVFVDGHDLVLLDARTAELGRWRTDHSERRLREAFVAHGHPWSEGDPYADEFRRWADGMPELDGHAQSLLRSRRAALKEKDAEDAAELREELAAVGILVREEGHRQYWRRARPRVEGSKGEHGNENGFRPVDGGDTEQGGAHGTR